jgi:hypothetical protein
MSWKPFSGMISREKVHNVILRRKSTLRIIYSLVDVHRESIVAVT